MAYNTMTPRASDALSPGALFCATPRLRFVAQGATLALALVLMVAFTGTSYAERDQDGPTVITGDDRPVHEETERKASAGPAVNPPSLSLGLRLFKRTLSFSQDVLGNLPSYELPTAFSMNAGFSWFPISDMTQSVGGRLGLVGDFNYAPGVVSATEAVEEISTEAWGMRAGVRFDWISGGHSVSAGLGFGRDDFNIEDTTLKVVPGVSYEYLEFQLSGRISLIGPVNAVMDLGYQHLLSLGEIGSHVYFPNATGRGFSVVAGLCFEVVSSLEVRTTFEYQRYGLKMNSEKGASFVAGGALDERMGGMLSLAYHFNGE